MRWTPLRYFSAVTVLEVIQRSTQFLEKRGIESPRLQSELLLAHVLHKARLELYLEFERVLTAPEIEQMRICVKRRSDREPLQHIVGTVCFCGLELHTSSAALVPRPETELLAEHAWTRLNGMSACGRKLQVLDFGTGTGCIALAIAWKVPRAEVVALDISEKALALARANVRKHALENRIQLVESDGLNALRPEARFDLIVSNPPYIPRMEIASLEPEVRDHDPKLALDGGEDGLDCYRYLAREALPFCQPGGSLMLEVGDDQATAVSALLLEHGWIVESVLKDDSQRERFVLAGR